MNWSASMVIMTPWILWLSTGCCFFEGLNLKPIDSQQLVGCVEGGLCQVSIFDCCEVVHVVDAWCEEDGSG